MPTDLPTTANHPDVQAAKTRLTELAVERDTLQQKRAELEYEENALREKRLQADALWDEPTSEFTEADRDRAAELHQEKKAEIDKLDARAERLERKIKHGEQALMKAQIAASKDVKQTLDAALAERSRAYLEALQQAHEAQQAVQEVYAKYDRRRDANGSTQTIAIKPGSTLDGASLHVEVGSQVRPLPAVIDKLEAFVTDLERRGADR
jgi:DNA repair exonuclease SbcCD ATPase subunit